MRERHQTPTLCQTRNLGFETLPVALERGVTSICVLLAQRTAPARMATGEVSIQEELARALYALCRVVTTTSTAVRYSHAAIYGTG